MQESEITNIYAFSFLKNLLLDEKNELYNGYVYWGVLSVY